MQLEARRVEVQTSNMEEAFNLANSMQAMTYDHRSYPYLKALCQDLLEAKEDSARKRGVERAQLMTERAVRDAHHPRDVRRHPRAQGDSHV